MIANAIGKTLVRSATMFLDDHRQLRKASTHSLPSEVERSGSQLFVEDSAAEESKSIDLPPLPRDATEDDEETLPTDEQGRIPAHILQRHRPSTPERRFTEAVTTRITIRNFIRRLRATATRKRTEETTDKRKGNETDRKNSERLEKNLLSKLNYQRAMAAKRDSAILEESEPVDDAGGRHQHQEQPKEPKIEQNGEAKTIPPAPPLTTQADPAENDSINQKQTWRQLLKNKIFKILKATVDETTLFYYYWTTLVAVGCLYSLLLLIARGAFTELQTQNEGTWILFDLLFDGIFIVDFVCVESRKGYLEQGVMVTKLVPLFKHYCKTAGFWLDLASIIPTDFLHVFWPGNPLIRANRLLKTHRLFDFCDKTESRTSFPYVFRITKMMTTIFVIFHWNSCIFFIVSQQYDIDAPGTDEWHFQYAKIVNPRWPECYVWNNHSGHIDAEDVCLYRGEPQFFCTQNPCQFDPIPQPEQIDWWWWRNLNVTQEWRFSNFSRQYIFSMYWSALTLVTIGEQRTPKTNGQFLFVIADILLGLLVFAAIIGTVSSMISSMNEEQAEFEATLDGAKQYMEYKKVEPVLQSRVIKWFNYTAQESNNDETIIDTLPTKLRAEIAIHVHLDTLKRVRIFQDCDPGLLVELVLKLKLQVFSPGDFICRKGDVGKEMYIVKQGSLNVVSEDGQVVFVTLKEGSVFGELSILDIPGNKNGNKRTAAVRSVGYSDLFVLSKDDLWDSLREYPETKKVLLAKGREILSKDGLLDEAYANVDAEPVRTLDQHLDSLADKVKRLNDNLDTLYKAFDAETALQKQRVTYLERLFNQNRRQIKRDCILGKL